MEHINATDNDNDNRELVQSNEEIDRILSISLAPRNITTGSPNNIQQPPQPALQRYCWVCFATEEDEDSAGHEWIKPCNCKLEIFIILCTITCYNIILKAKEH